MTDAREVAVLIGDVHAGTLRHEAEVATFRLEHEYVDLARRPVLGQVFEDDPLRIHQARNGLPAWFANLLPEGPLRELVAARVGVHQSREFFLLGHLGDDLPGAVRVHADSPEDLIPEEDSDLPIANGQTEGSEFDFKFSLAGVQLKFSVLLSDRGVTIPIAGKGGDYIAKLPDQRHEGVPENEYTMMKWIGMAGVNVPEFNLVPIETIEGLPEEYVDTGKMAFLIRRFDRVDGTRIHIEDFAQVLGVSPRLKYSATNYETIARILLALAGEEDLYEFVRRLVAIIAMGNGDAHLKNWSLIYPDGRQARLSPAYDFVSTVTYARGEETLALNLARSKSFADVSLNSFRRLARKLALPSERDLDAVVLDTVGRLQASWLDVVDNSPLDARVSEAIGERLQRLPLMLV